MGQAASGRAVEATLVARALCNVPVAWDAPQATRWLACVEQLAALPTDEQALRDAIRSLLTNATLTLPAEQLPGFYERVLSCSAHVTDQHVQLVHSRLP